jgi:hypothetical protein
MARKGKKGGKPLIPVTVLTGFLGKATLEF